MSGTNADLAFQIGRMSRFAWRGMATAALCAWVASASAEEPLTGPALDARLAAPVSAVWADLPLRQALDGILSWHVAVVIDRRVDSDRLINESLSDVPLADACQRLIGQRDCGWTRLEDVLYIGPAEAARRLRTLATIRRAEAKKLPIESRQLVEAKAAWSWDDLTTPRELFEALAAAAELKIDGLASVPHDLWAGARLPKLAWTDRLQLLATQYDLTFAIDAATRTVRLTPIPADLAIEKSYPRGRAATETAERWRQLAPLAEIIARGTNVVVRGLVEDHEAILAAQKGPPPAAVSTAAVPPDQRLYTLNSPHKPLRDLLTALEAMGVSFRWDDAALAASDGSLDTIVSVAVERATLDELLTAWLSPAGLSFRRQGATVEIVPRNP